MKAFILLALLGSALGAGVTITGYGPLSSIYATPTTAPLPAGGYACTLNPGYAIKYVGVDAAPPGTVNSTVVTWIVAESAVSPNCAFSSITGSQVILHLICAAGWTASNTAFAVGASNFVTTGMDVWSTMAATLYMGAGAGVTAYNFATATSASGTFTCVRLTCPYTCTGTGCVIGATGALNAGTTAQICACGAYPTAAGTDGTNIFTCPIAGIATNTALSCSTTGTATTLVVQQNLVARSAIVRTIPTQCNCDTSSPSCPAINANSPQCTGCNACALGGGQSGQRIVYCSGLTTWAAIEDCLHQAACAGVIRTKFDTCVVQSDFCASANCNNLTAPYVFDPTLTLPFTCPTCPGKSKKLLLLLLLLLLLIPAFLCSLLCCLFFLCCIRRKKKGVPAHMATFDAGAAPLQPIFTHHEHVVPSHHVTVTQALDHHAYGFHY